MSISIKLGSWDELGVDAMQVRWPVFVIEQHVPSEIEQDEHDISSVHGVMYNQSGQAIATGRLLSDGHIGRIAVLQNYRGLGLGKQLLAQLMVRAKEQGHTEVVLSAQLSALAFYEKAGFVVTAEPHVEAGIEHVQMRHRFS